MDEEAEIPGKDTDYLRYFSTGQFSFTVTKAPRSIYLKGGKFCLVILKAVSDPVGRQDITAGPCGARD